MYEKKYFCPVLSCICLIKPMHTHKTPKQLATLTSFLCLFQMVLCIFKQRKLFILAFTIAHKYYTILFILYLAFFPHNNVI